MILATLKNLILAGLGFLITAAFFAVILMPIVTHWWRRRD